MAASSLSAGAPVRRREKTDEERGSLLPLEPPAQPVMSEAGRCTCCPYGYHIDLDFLNFCKNITNGAALSNLKRIQRTKRKLRKSMELMLEQQQHGQEGSSSPSSLTAPTPPPPDVVHSTEASRLIHMVNYEQSATHQVLWDIDCAVNATLSSIDSMQQHSTSQQRHTSLDSEDSFSYSPISPLPAFDGYPSQSPLPPPPPPRRSSLRYAHSQSEGDDDIPERKDSMSSVSSVSTVSSEQQVLGLSGGAHWRWPAAPATSPSVHSSESSGFMPHQLPEEHPQIPAMTSESLAATMVAHFPQRQHHEGSEPPSPMSPNTTISKASLAAIREAMSVSLQRMRDLEDQVKAIPILQVRISVLKEEKRLLALQLKAKSGNVSMRTVAVGDEDKVTSPLSTTATFQSWRSPTLKTPPPTLPKPSWPFRRDKGVGEHSVVEPYLLQPSLPTGYTIVDNQVQNEIRSKWKEKEMGSLGSTHSLPQDTLGETTTDHRQSVPPPATQRVGVEDGDINAHPLHVHNTEVHTVIIGAGSSTPPVKKRNVGVEVKVPSHSVGVSFSSSQDAAPTTRSVGINVSGDDLAPLDSRGESELHAALHNVLQRQVHSAGIQCSVQPIVEEKSVQHEMATVVSVGCGREEGDEGGISVPQRCVGTMAKAESSEVSVGTEVQEEEEERGVRGVDTSDVAVNTESSVKDTVSTSTDLLSVADSTSQTDMGVFEQLEVIISTGSNTHPVPTATSSTNTPTPPTTTHQAVNTTPMDTASSSDDKPEVVSKEYCDRSVSTPSKELQLSMSKVECVEILGEDIPAASKRPLTMQELIIQRGASQASAFLGSTSSTGSLSPTSPQRLSSSTEPTLADSSSSKAEPRASANASAGDCLEVEDREVKERVVESTVASWQESSQPAAEVGQGEEGDSEQTHFVSDSFTDTPVRRRGGSSGTKLVSSSRLHRHRYSDGARFSLELDPHKLGMFSGRRVGSVEDFMPDEMRRLMNLDTTDTDSSSSSWRTLETDFSSSHSVKKSSLKVTSTVTIKQGGQESSSLMSAVTETEHVPESLEMADPETDCQERGGFGKLSSAHFDLSQIADDDESELDENDKDQDDNGEEQDDNEDDLPSLSELSEIEGGGIKDSGYDDSTLVSNGATGSQAADYSSMGSLERRELKSIMKTSKPTECPTPKKGISFADSVVGGTGSSSEEEEGTDTDEESSASYDEGSYDGREGDITYQCQDDEAIAQGLPGAKMYDQNIRETYELSEEMQQACQVLANFLVDSTTIQTKELNANLSVVQEEWFRVSSHKLSSVHQVEDYLSSINEISHRLLEYVVNLIDSNGNAAIHYCVSHCNFDIVGLLLDTEVCDVRRPNKAGYTPTMLASLAFIQNDDHRNIIRQLFTASDVNARAETSGQTALMLAISQCRTDMVELLLETGANCNLQDDDGSTALMCACEHGHTAIVELLLAHPTCDATLTDNENSTALSIAMEAGHKDIGVILYKHLNFSGPGVQKKRKGSSSPTPSI